MPPITWHPGLHIGIPEIDEQHEKLTGMINELCLAHAEGRDKAVLSEIIIGVSDYAGYHFDAEEKRMREAADPEIEAHLAQHREFLGRSIGFLLSFVDGREELTVEVLDYLTGWWVAHITGTDKNLGRYLAGRGAAS
jgi:hemerythrin-like metal-binding protein